MQLKLRRGWPFIFAKSDIYATIILMKNKEIFITNNSKETQKLGEILGKELRDGEIICLSGDLGSGKTTFAQGVLKGLGAKGPFSSPTFIVMKEYKKTKDQRLKTKNIIQNIYHIDCYRVKVQDILDLGWEEIIAGKNNVLIVEWAERIKTIIPKSAIWFKFEHMRDNERKIRIK
jgi:tRNA threonylcarbamoyladenosine biosynthesis protein TsaE